MYYYEHHIGDYAQATSHLTFIEDAALMRLLRKYYANEKPLPIDIKAVQRLAGARTRSEKQAVSIVLEEFFVLQEDGWHNKRCDREIAKYREKCEKARESANARWKKAGDAQAADRSQDRRQYNASAKAAPRADADRDQARRRYNTSTTVASKNGDTPMAMKNPDHEVSPIKQDAPPASRDAIPDSPDPILGSPPAVCQEGGYPQAQAGSPQGCLAPQTEGDPACHDAANGSATDGEQDCGYTMEDEVAALLEHSADLLQVGSSHAMPEHEAKKTSDNEPAHHADHACPNDSVDAKPEKEKKSIDSKVIRIVKLARDAGVDINPFDPKVKYWAEQDYSNEQILHAIEVAKEQRKKQQNPQPINTGYLDSIIRSHLGMMSWQPSATPKYMPRRRTIHDDRADIIHGLTGRSNQQQARVIHAEVERVDTNNAESNPTNATNAPNMSNQAMASANNDTPNDTPSMNPANLSMPANTGKAPSVLSIYENTPKHIADYIFLKNFLRGGDF